MSEYENAIKLLETAEERIDAIDKEMQDLKYKLYEVKGTLTEVYTRIVGYYRNVNNWNPGKKDEYGIRQVFDVAPSWMQPGSEK